MCVGVFAFVCVRVCLLLCTCVRVVRVYVRASEMTPKADMKQREVSDEAIVERKCCLWQWWSACLEGLRAQKGPQLRVHAVLGDLVQTRAQPFQAWGHCSDLFSSPFSG